MDDKKVVYDIGASYSNGRILSSSELEEMKRNLNILSNAVENYITKTQQVIKTFNDQNIVQSFYSSGKFGNKQRQKLEKISNALKKYWNVIENGEGSMIAQTRKYIELSLENVSGGNVIYVAKDDKVEGWAEAMPLYSDDTSTHATKDYKSLDEYLVEHSLDSAGATVSGGAK